MYWIIYTLILLVGVTAPLALLMVLRRRIQAKKVRTFLENGTVMLVALLLTLMAAELFFKLFFAQPDGFRYTLASQNWYDRYWAENSLGYRDEEWGREQVADKTKVMVVGDSFVAGAGIANPEDRFANQLGQLLGDDYVVFNVASPGWDTIDEIEAIIEYPYRPDILVLSYYINDIEGTAYNSGLKRPQIRQNTPAWLNPLVEHSYAFNFVYWRLIRLGPQQWANIYWNDWLRMIAEDPIIRWRHRQELLKIVAGTASEDIDLFVVVFPSLTAVEESGFLTQPVIDLFQAHGVPVLEVSEILAGRPPTETTVNAIDSHPNEAINAEVARRLYQMMIENGIVEKTPAEK